MYTTESYREMCLKCHRPKSNCYCKDIVPFETKVHIVILMHPMEAYKQKTGTGRLAQLSLINSEIIIGLDFSHNKRVNEIIDNPDNQSFVLYPNAQSINISHSESYKNIDLKKNLYIFLIDSTWSCSKKVMKLSQNLVQLPTITFDIKETSRFAIKKQPKSFCLSTIEAIYYLLDELEKNSFENVGGKKEALLETLKKMVDFQLECKNRD